MGTPIDPASFALPFPARSLDSGGAAYLTGEDALRVTVFNAAPGVTVTITGRMLPFGQMRSSPFTQTLTPATDRSSSTVTFPLGDGWLVNAQAIVSGGTPALGQTFVRLSIVRGLMAGAVELFTLCAGYVSTKQPISFPGSPVGSTLDGPGVLRSIVGTNPAAGAESTETVPTGARWQILSWIASLVASATVATRQLEWVATNGAQTFLLSPAQTSQAASTTRNYMAAAVGAAQTAVNGRLQVILPPIVVLTAGFQFGSFTTSIQVDDDWGAPTYNVLEWLDE